ncbi:Serine/threonine-protein kinase pim-2 [Triplophysa tibetana]|uniref:non-specific serine/threonine protein kinase n=1 Tax=Triplophysa tibetana TaxID=1572043 RepID=A0A5A9PUX4_9TELE|nr:Serine/threonine-protein kinase pim-2 [Triplophysa tibetana]
MKPEIVLQEVDIKLRLRHFSQSYDVECSGGRAEFYLRHKSDEIPVQPVTSEAEVLTAVDVHQTPAFTEPGVLPMFDGSSWTPRVVGHKPALRLIISGDRALADWKLGQVDRQAQLLRHVRSQVLKRHLFERWLEVKFVTKSDEDEYISIPGHPEPLMQEVALHILISKGDKVPEIIELLDWQEHADRYVMVLESFAPCKDLLMFLKEDQLDEYLANRVMFQATRAAFICCKRGVLHRDIKLQNLLINTDTFEVKLIDFGCCDLLKEPAYDTYMECCSLNQACLQENPKERIELRQILKHKWFETPLDPVETLSDSDEDELPLASFNLAEKKLEDEEKQFENLGFLVNFCF